MPSLKGRDNHKHGMSGTPEYMAWKNMRGRCHNPRNQEYGGRGISICPQWLDSFETFHTDMGPRPSPEHSVDRIDVNGNYEPSNCRWATATEQVINRRKHRSNTSGVTGVVWHSRDRRWHAQIWVDYIAVHLGYFKEKNLAIAARKVAEIKYYDSNKLILLEE